MVYFNLWMRRYGLIMSIVASRDLVAGEEVFVSYNYALEKAPEWYQVSRGRKYMQTQMFKPQSKFALHDTKFTILLNNHILLEPEAPKTSEICTILQACALCRPSKVIVNFTACMHFKSRSP